MNFAKALVFIVAIILIGVVILDHDFKSEHVRLEDIPTECWVRVGSYVMLEQSIGCQKAAFPGGDW